MNASSLMIANIIGKLMLFFKFMSIKKLCICYVFILRYICYLLIKVKINLMNTKKNTRLRMGQTLTPGDQLTTGGVSIPC